MIHIHDTCIHIAPGNLSISEDWRSDKIDCVCKGWVLRHMTNVNPNLVASNDQDAHLSTLVMLTLCRRLVHIGNSELIDTTEWNLQRLCAQMRTFIAKDDVDQFKDCLLFRSGTTFIAPSFSFPSLC